MGKVYSVKLVRPVFQWVVIEVESWSLASAKKTALRKAAALSANEWAISEFHDRDYAMHVECAMDHQEIHETCPNPHQEIRTFQSTDQASENIRYLLLAADVENREGDCLPQPWFERADSMLQSELCLDWIDPLSFITENDGLGDGGLHRLIECETHEADNVIDFPVSHMDEEVAQVTF